MNVPFVSFVPLGGQELFILLGIPLLYILPIWLSLRWYGPEQRQWRAISIIASLLMSWVGFILVRAIHSGFAGYQEGRASKTPPR